ncbi:MAG TPA: hypothetical protein VIK99_06960 [Thermaerobacter sp.]
MFGHIGNMDLIREGLQYLAGHEARLIARRWGLDGGPPRSIAELARELGVAPIEMARRLRALEAKLLQAMSRSAAAGPGSPVAGAGRTGNGAGPAAAGPAAPPGEPLRADARTRRRASQEQEEGRS